VLESWTVEKDFSHAVFLHENAYLGGKLNYEAFKEAIRIRAEIAKRIAQNKPTQKYLKADSFQVQLQASIFKFLTDTTQIEFGEGRGEKRAILYLLACKLRKGHIHMD